MRAASQGWVPGRHDDGCVCAPEAAHHWVFAGA